MSLAPVTKLGPIEIVGTLGAGNPSHYDTAWRTTTSAVASSNNKFTRSGQYASCDFHGTPIKTAGDSGTFKATGIPVQLCTRQGPGPACKERRV